MHLNEFLDNTFFVAVFESVYGRSPEETGFRPLPFKRSLNVLYAYHYYLWLGVPHWLNPKAQRAIKRCQNQRKPAEMPAKADEYQVSDYIRLTIEAMQKAGQLDSDIVSHNVAYLHVNETIKLLAFLVVYLFATHQKALADVRNEVDAFVDGCLVPDTNNAEMSLKELMKG